MPTKLKLMVVDDEPDNLDLLYRTFRRDFQVFKAEVPVSALQILEQEGEMAVIISDQSMPEMTGTEFLTKTKERFPHTMRILLTGYSDDSLDEEAGRLNGAELFKCITKPFDPQELKAIVQQAAEIYQTAKSGNGSL